MAGEKKCEKCGTKECYGGKDCFEIRDRSLSAYRDEETLALTRTSTALEAEHYMEFTRIESLTPGRRGVSEVVTLHGP